MSELKPGIELDALVARRWTTKKINWKDPRPYRCSKCGGEEHFVYGKEKRRVCKHCHKLAQARTAAKPESKKRKKEWAINNSHKYKSYRKEWSLKKRYGISLRQYLDMVRVQKGACLICCGNQSLRRPLVVDHCHKTGKIRGLLCDPCNIGIENFRENKNSLVRAIVYLSERNK